MPTVECVEMNKRKKEKKEKRAEIGAKANEN